MSGLSFQLQCGLVRETVTLDIADASLKQLKQEAVKFVIKNYPQHGLGENIADHLLLYKHDFRSVNILQLLTTGDMVNDGTLVEVVITPCPQHERLVVHPHTLYVHSYKTPTFCDFCGELLFGIVKQGLKCQGCGLNYHKRCASKIPNNCSGSRQRRPSAIPLSPRNSATVVAPLSSFSASRPSVGWDLVMASSCECANSARLSLSTTTTTLGPTRSSISGVSGTGTPSQIPTSPIDIYVTTGGDHSTYEEGGMESGGNQLQMPRKDRSSSWSGRPLWMEVAEATRIKVPHTFQVHSYKKPTVCQYCKKLLKGLIRQGIQCRDCKYNCHKKCSSLVPKDCSGGLSRDQQTVSSFLDTVGSEKSSNFGGSMENLHIATTADELDDDDGGGDDEAIEHASSDTKTDSAKKADQSLVVRLHKKTQATPSAPLQGQKENERNQKQRAMQFNKDSPPPDEGDLNESQNIPLMRIVMSKKQTKRPSNKTLREGWLIHYTDRQSMRKKHYWRLDTKAITMFKDETSNGFFKELPLSEILEVRSVADLEREQEHEKLKRELTHYFEIKTQASTYFIASAPAPTSDAPSTTATQTAQMSPILNAANWASAIKQALMPVTTQSSTPSIHEVRRDGGAHRSSARSDMVQLKVPVPGETGQLGGQIQSEAEFSQLYQIFADEILGSGQFGTVYGGIHRKTGRHVAVKLIDKSKFPTNKEAALRSEVEILQKVRHQGVVEFQQMLETPDRIFVVMEKLKGDMLEMILSSEKGRLSERCTRFLITQVPHYSQALPYFSTYNALLKILISLQYLHSRNVVHCDLKPENILLTSHSDFPQVKLCDFGFARIIGEKSFRRSVVGTPAYLAPEVLRNRGFNRSLDMWSVGVIVYVSLSGTFPFNEDEDINDQIQNAEFMYPPSPWREVTEEAIEFINSLLQVKMNKRLTVSKALSHIWLQSYQLWSDLRCLEKEVSERFVTHECDDARWHDYEKANSITPIYL